MADKVPAPPKTPVDPIEAAVWARTHDKDGKPKPIVVPS